MFDGHGFGFGGAFMWLFWILLIVGIVWALKVTAFSDTKRGGMGKSPMEILQERLARGEIDEDEFERKRRLLNG